MTLLPLPERIAIREVGLRDGLQMEAPLTVEARLTILDALVAAGLRRIEATAFVSPRAIPAMVGAEQIAAACANYPGVEFSALVPNARGAQRAIDAGLPNLEYVISASDSHSCANTGRTTAQALEAVAEVASLTHSAGGLCEVIVACAWDCPFEGPTGPDRVLDIVFPAMAAGVDRLCLADTIGTVTPTRAVRLIDAVRGAAPGVDVGIHLHNTRGTALACVLAALQVGVTSIDASIGGLGGCPFAPGASGNLATEELAYMCRDMDVATGLDIPHLLSAAREAADAIRHDLPSALLKAGDRLLTRPTARDERHQP